MKLVSKVLAPFAALLIGSSAQAGLIINSVDMFVADSTSRVTNTSTFLGTLADFGQSYDDSPICAVSLESLDGVGAKYDCGTRARRNTGTMFLVNGYSTGNSQIQFGLDWGRGGFSALSFNGSTDINRYTNDIWWGRRWNHPDVLNFNIVGNGAFSLLLVGFEACCSGINSARWRSVDGPTIAQVDAPPLPPFISPATPWETLTVNAALVPIPSGIFLVGLGLLGMASVRGRGSNAKPTVSC